VIAKYTRKINFSYWVSIQSHYPCRDFTSQDYFQNYVQAGKKLYEISSDEERVIKHCTKDNYRLIIIYRKNLTPLVLFDPYEIIDKAYSNGLADYCLRVNKRIFSGEQIRSNKELRASANLVFEVLYTLPEDKIILYLPTVLILVRLAGVDGFIRSSQFFSDTDSYHSLFEELKEDPLFHNRVCLATGKILKSLGLFASRTQYDSFIDPDTMNSMCKSLYKFALTIAKKKKYLSGQDCENLKNHITKFCKTSINGKSISGREHSTQINNGFYPKVHGNTIKELIGNFKNDFNVDGINNGKYLGHSYSKSLDEKWCFNFHEIFEFLHSTIHAKTTIKPISKSNFISFIKTNLQIKDLIDQTTEFESKYNKSKLIQENN
jgi:hypothetical protein